MTPDLDRLVARAGAARFVLLGEATHGTHEFYAIRAEVTKRLITEHGFRAADEENARDEFREVAPDLARVLEVRDATPALGDYVAAGQSRSGHG